MPKIRTKFAKPWALEIYRILDRSRSYSCNERKKNKTPIRNLESRPINRWYANAQDEAKP